MGARVCPCRGELNRLCLKSSFNLLDPPFLGAIQGRDESCPYGHPQPPGRRVPPALPSVFQSTGIGPCQGLGMLVWEEVQDSSCRRAEGRLSPSPVFSPIDGGETPPSPGGCTGTSVWLPCECPWSVQRGSPPQADAEGLVVDSPQDEGCPPTSTESPFAKGGPRGFGPAVEKELGSAVYCSGLRDWDSNIGVQILQFQPHLRKNAFTSSASRGPPWPEKRSLGE